MFPLPLFSELDFVHYYMYSTISESLVSDRSNFEYTVLSVFQDETNNSLKPFAVARSP